MQLRIGYKDFCAGHTPAPLKNLLMVGQKLTERSNARKEILVAKRWLGWPLREELLLLHSPCAFLRLQVLAVLRNLNVVSTVVLVVENSGFPVVSRSITSGGRRPFPGQDDRWTHFVAGSLSLVERPNLMCTYFFAGTWTSASAYAHHYAEVHHETIDEL